MPVFIYISSSYLRMPGGHFNGSTSVTDSSNKKKCSFTCKRKMASLKLDDVTNRLLLCFIFLLMPQPFKVYMHYLLIQCTTILYI